MALWSKEKCTSRHLQSRWKFVYHPCTEHMRLISGPGKSKIPELPTPLCLIPSRWGIWCNCKVKNKYALRSSFTLVIKTTFILFTSSWFSSFFERITIRKQSGPLLTPCKAHVYLRFNPFCHNSETWSSFLKTEKEGSQLGVSLAPWEDSCSLHCQEG